MNKLFLSAVSVLAIAGVAVAADSTQFGVLYVPSTAKETIVSVPWLESGTGNDPVENAIKVADLVLTAGLELNDELMLYTGSGSSYSCWILAQDGKGNKYWNPGTTVTSAEINTAAGANDATLKRGQAIILKRKAASISKGFYIMGKPSSATATVELIANGYSLVAPPSVTNTAVNSMAWSNINGKTDSLIVADGQGGTTTFTWKNSGNAWMKKTNEGTWTTEDVTIPAGTGAWFKNGEATAKSVTWTSSN